MAASDSLDRWLRAAVGQSAADRRSCRRAMCRARAKEKVREGWRGRQAQQARASREAKPELASPMFFIEVGMSSFGLGAVDGTASAPPFQYSTAMGGIDLHALAALGHWIPVYLVSS
ncbi:MAG: hypothetical protein H6924_03495 [Alphaproteobacteria bacterium]|nr:hypothetical protein [Alphaproteobacteria bacterium]